MNPTESKFRDDLDAIASQLDLGVQRGRYTWSDFQERLKSKTTELANSTDRYLHEYTWTSLALMAGLSALAGYLLSRREPPIRPR